MNKYTKWYTSITNNAKQRNLGCYTESHHINPRSLGGPGTPDNLVELTPQEHFICHWLLVKMTTGQDHYKMLNALRMMRAENPNQQRYNTKITARVYAKIKEEYAELQSKRFTGKGNGMFGKQHTQEAKDKIRQARLGNKLTPEQHARLVANTTGKTKPPITEEHRAKLSAAKQGKNNNRYGVEVSAETRAKISAKAIGRKQSEETIRKKADAVRGSKREKKLCPYCNQNIAVNTYPRFHGDKCKHKKS